MATKYDAGPSGSRPRVLLNGRDVTEHVIASLQIEVNDPALRAELRAGCHVRLELDFVLTPKAPAPPGPSWIGSFSAN